MSKNLDEELRERLRAWIWYYWQKYEHQYPTQADFAKFLGVAPPTINTILSGRRTVGLDVLAKLHQKLHVSADVLIDTDPPNKAENPGSALPRKHPTARRGRVAR